MEKFGVISWKFAFLGRVSPELLARDSQNIVVFLIVGD